MDIAHRVGSEARELVVSGNGLPAAVLRGGHWNNGTQAGAFVLDLSYAPSFWSASIGFRCVRGR